MPSLLRVDQLLEFFEVEKHPFPGYFSVLFLPPSSLLDHVKLTGDWVFNLIEPDVVKLDLVFVLGGCHVLL